jgi:hypothetical protein
VTRIELHQQLIVQGPGGKLEKLMRYSRDCIRFCPKSAVEEDIAVGITRIGWMLNLGIKQKIKLS